jgi:hypothetical protein
MIHFKMKNIILILILCTLSAKSFSQQKVTIDEFATRILKIKNFDTTKDIIIQISDTTIKKVAFLNFAKKFQLLTLNPVSDGGSNKVDTIKPFLNPNDSLILYAYNNLNDSVLISLKKDDAQSNEKDKSSTINRGCGEVKDYDHNFGEEVKYYDEDKVVYVYDFNRDPAKREFYKITKSGETLKRELVNFNKEKLISSKNVKFKIYNINKFMYNVSIDDSVVQFESEPPALFTQFFLGDSTTLLGNLMEAFSNNVTAQNFNQTDAKSLVEKIDTFINKYNGLRDTALRAFDPCHTFTCCSSINYADFLNLLSEIKSQTENVKRKLNFEKNRAPDCKNQLKLKVKVESDVKTFYFALSKLNLNFEELNFKSTVLSNNVDRIREEIKLIESQVFFSKGADSLTKRAQITRLETELISKTNELSTCRVDLAKVRKDRDSLAIKSFELENSIDSIKYNISLNCADSTQELIDALERSDYLIAHLPTDDELKKLIIFINNMVETNNSHTSDYISLNGNMLDLTITITSKDSIIKYLHGISYNKSTSIQIPIVGKPFVSFSSGSFIALGKHLQNKTYAWQEAVGNNNTAVDTSYTLVESGYTLPPMGFCALANLEWKVYHNFGLGASFGVGLTIEKSPRLAYLGGISLFFGDLRQFTLTGGFAGMQVEKLSNNLQAVGDNQIIYASKPDKINTYQEFKIGAFLSLTYTPFKVYKTKSVKSKDK